MLTNEERLPVLVGQGQFTDRNTDGSGLPPLEMIATACRSAAEDAGSNKILDSASAIAIAGLTVDAPQAKTPISGGYKNVPRSVANLLGINPKNFYYATTGGNTPQYFINRFAQQIACGQAETVLLAGGESLATMVAKFNRLYKWWWLKSDWRDDPGGKPQLVGDLRPANTAYEERHGLDLPATIYPLFENALQHQYGRTNSEHLAAIAELFSGFSSIAENNPYAWFQQFRSALELATTTAQNRMVAYPYTKLLNSMIGVNQSAAIIMTSAAKARQLGIAEEQWVYLHGGADGNDIWNVSERANFYTSPALEQCGQQSLAMAGKTIDQIQHFDIYSCFPAAVQVACDALGIQHHDPRGLTLTGGLPYFGGPGNNYSMHAVAEMMRRLRQHPGDFGLLNANGWYLTKHSVGVYSTQPAAPVWQSPVSTDAPLAMPHDQRPTLIESPIGAATIETYTVLFDRQHRMTKVIIVGRDREDRRFLANTPQDPEMMAALLSSDPIGRRGTVKAASGIRARGKNCFALD